jgi:hypothetical protein
MAALGRERWSIREEREGLECILLILNSSKCSLGHSISLHKEYITKGERG